MWNCLMKMQIRMRKVIPTQRDLLAGIVAKHYAKRHILPRDVVEAHEKRRNPLSRLRLRTIFPDV